jgi:hypothetical protein
MMSVTKKNKVNGDAQHAPEQDNSLIKWATRMAVILLLYTVYGWLDTIKVSLLFAGF